jgi:hypothetical protein
LEVIRTAIIKNLLGITGVLTEPFQMRYRIFGTDLDHWSWRHGARKPPLDLEAESVIDSSAQWH